MSRGRPEIPPSWVIDLNAVVDKVYSAALNCMTEMPWGRLDIDVVIPVWESFPESTASHLVYILDHKIYMSNKSRFVEYLETSKGDNKFYIYDKFKANSYSHKKGYKQLTFEVPYADDTEESVFLPVYWRVN